MDGASEVLDTVISHKNMKQGIDNERIDKGKLVKEFEQSLMHNKLAKRHAMIKEHTKKELPDDDVVAVSH